MSRFSLKKEIYLLKIKNKKYDIYIGNNCFYYHIIIYYTILYNILYYFYLLYDNKNNFFLTTGRIALYLCRNSQKDSPRNENLHTFFYILYFKVF